MDLPLHPRLVHLPIALAVLMPLVTAGLAVAWWRRWLPRRAWLIAVLLQGVLVGAGLLAQRSGEADEERVERRVAEPVIEAHEEAAEGFLIGAGLVLVVVVAAAAVPREVLGQGLAGVAVAGALAVLWLGYRVGEAGGRLVYQHGAAAVYVTPGAAAGQAGEGAVTGQAGEGGAGEAAAPAREHHDDDDDDDDD